MHPTLNIAISAARSAGNIIARAYGRRDNLKVQEKTSPADLVTNTDKEAENEIIAIINKAYPKHSILGEESGLVDNGSEVRWIIDPIDGTYNFVRGIPEFAVSIGIEVSGVMEHGVVYNPITNDLYTATRGSGAKLNDKRIRVRNTTKLEHALLAMGLSSDRRELTLSDYMPHVLPLFYQAAEIRCGGAASLELAQVASGVYDGYAELGVSLWDVAAGQLLVLEAGGFVTDYKGGHDTGKAGIIAGTPKIHASMFNALQHVI